MQDLTNEINNISNTPNISNIPNISNDIQNHIAGMIYGASLADAVGLPMKFESTCNIDKIVFPYPDSVRDFTPCDWSENIDFMLIIAQSIIKYDLGVISHNILANDFVHWMHKGLTSNDIIGNGLSKSMQMIIGDPNYISDPVKSAENFYKLSNNTFNTNCSLIRAIICAIIQNKVEVISFAIFQSMLSHVDSKCIYGCVLYTLILHELLYNIPTSMQQVDDILSYSRETAQNSIYQNANILDEIDKIILDASNNNLDEFHLDKPSNMSYILKTLSCCIYALRIIKHSINHKKRINFKQTIVFIASKGGDAPANCAVVGAIIGAFMGYKALPSDWIAALPDKTFLDDVVNGLLRK